MKKQSAVKIHALASQPVAGVLSCFILCLYPQRQEWKDFSTALVVVSYLPNSVLSLHPPPTAPELQSTLEAV